MYHAAAPACDVTAPVTASTASGAALTPHQISSQCFRTNLRHRMSSAELRTLIRARLRLKYLRPIHTVTDVATEISRS